MRLFIAINLPENNKNSIEETVNKIQPFFDSSARFVPPENWHLTLTFLGYQPAEAIDLILKATEETAAEFSAPEVELEKILWAPPDRPVKRMIWVNGSKKTSEILGEIKNTLEEKLIKNKVKFKIDYPKLNAHLTLVRFQNSSKSLLLQELPDFQPIVFRAKTLDLMESHLKRSGAEYETISQFAFK
jgi:2'-5' RNA ligase